MGSIQRTRLWLLLTALLALAPLGSALAAKPEIRTFEVPVEDAVAGTCGTGNDAFDVVSNTIISVRETTFYDKDGNVDRLQVHLMFHGTLTNSSTGKTVTDQPDPINVFIEDGVEREVGLIWHIVVPGEGVLVIEAGVRIKAEGEETIIHGPHPVLEGGFEVICQVLE